jgi:hypothetical protein
MYVPWVHRRIIPNLNRTIYWRWVGGWKISLYHWMNRRCLLCHLSGRFVLAGDQGFFVGCSRRTFLLAYLVSNWLKVGQLWSADHVRYIAHASPFKLCVEANVSSHGRTVRLGHPGCLFEHRTVHAQVSDSSRCLSKGAVLGYLIEPAPSASRLVSLPVRRFPSNPSLWYIRRVRITNGDVFAFAFIDHFGPNQDFLLASYIKLAGNGCVSTYIP